jgi:hypothetical protein
VLNTDPRRAVRRHRGSSGAMDLSLLVGVLLQPPAGRRCVPVQAVRVGRHAAAEAELIATRLDLVVEMVVEMRVHEPPQTAPARLDPAAMGSGVRRL